MDEVSGAKRKELLREHRELALLSKKLASLERDVPIDVDAAAVLPHQPQRDKLEELFTRFEFHTLLERVEPLLPGPGSDGADSGGTESEGSGPGGERSALRPVSILLRRRAARKTWRASSIGRARWGWRSTVADPVSGWPRPVRTGPRTTMPPTRLFVLTVLEKPRPSCARC